MSSMFKVLQNMEKELSNVQKRKLCYFRDILIKKKQFFATDNITDYLKQKIYMKKKLLVDS